MPNIDNIGDHPDGALPDATVGANGFVMSASLFNLLSNTVFRPLSVTIADGAGSPTEADRTLTDAEFFGNVLLDLGGTPSVAYDLIVPAKGNKRFLCRNGSGQTATVTTRSGTTVDVPVGAIYELHNDGTDIIQVSGVKGTVYDFGATFESAPDAGLVFGRVPIARDIVIPPDFAGSFGKVDTNPAESFAIDVRDDGVSRGTITVSTGGVFTFATTSNAQVLVASGSVMTFVAPALSPAETTIAGLSMGILATVR